MLMRVEEVILQGPKQGCIRYGSWRKLQEGKNFRDSLLRSLIWIKGCVCPLWVKSRHMRCKTGCPLPLIATAKADMCVVGGDGLEPPDRKSTRLNSSHLG